MLYNDIKSANHLAKVEKHAAELEKAADHMDAAGIGGHPTKGHAVMLRRMAADLRANAAKGELPAVFDQFNAAADTDSEMSARQARMLAHGRGRPLTMLEAVRAAGDDQGRLTALSNLRARSQRLGYKIPDDSVVDLDELNRAIAAGHGSISDRIALKSDLARYSLIS